MPETALASSTVAIFPVQRSAVGSAFSMNRNVAQLPPTFFITSTIFSRRRPVR